MIQELTKNLHDILSVKTNSRLLLRRTDAFIAYLIYLKYLCDTGKYDYEEVIQSDQLYEITHDIKHIKSFYLSNETIPINLLLVKIKSIDTRKLLIEFLDSLKKPVFVHQKDNTIAFVNIISNIYSYYCREGNATYLLPRTDDVQLFQAFDQILGIYNTYTPKKEDIENIDYVYIIEPILRKDYNILISSFLDKNQHVVFLSSYRHICNFKKGKYIVKALRTVIIKEEEVYLVFDKQHKEEFTIINYDQEFIKNQEQLQKIIDNNRKQKDVLVKVSNEEFRENNYRIAFNLYQLDKANPIRDINKTVDDNTRLLERLNTLNERVEIEINRLLNK